MSELDDAVARLEAAVARLENASPRAVPGIADEQVVAIAEAIAMRIDAALARLGQLLDRDNDGREE